MTRFNKIVYLVLGILLAFLSACVQIIECNQISENRYPQYELKISDTSSISSPSYSQITEVDSMPSILSRAIPKYPCDAKKAGLEGMVTLKVLLGEDGKPICYVVVSPENKQFVAESVNAVMETHFSPAKKDGKPIKVWVTVPYGYRLRK